MEMTSTAAPERRVPGGAAIDLKLIREIRDLATELDHIGALKSPNARLDHLTGEVLDQKGEDRTQTLIKTRDSYAGYVSGYRRRRARRRVVLHMLPFALLLAVPPGVMFLMV